MHVRVTLGGPGFAAAIIEYYRVGIWLSKSRRCGCILKGVKVFRT
jgi:hypothetical protein